MINYHVSSVMFGGDVFYFKAEENVAVRILLQIKCRYLEGKNRLVLWCILRQKKCQSVYIIRQTNVCNQTKRIN